MLQVLPWQDAKVIHQICSISEESLLPSVPCTSFKEQMAAWTALKIQDIRTCQQPHLHMLSLGIECDWKIEEKLPLITSFHRSFVKGKNLFIKSYYKYNH